MIRSAILLLRSSLPSVLVLAVSLLTLINIVSEEPESGGDTASETILPSSPLPKAADAPGAGSAILQSALFDPGRRSETVSGSIDDLRGDGQSAVASPVTIAGVLLAGATRKAMLSLGGAAPAWSEVGSEIGGWRVASVDTEGAVIERDGQSVMLKVADRYKLRGKAQVEPGATSPDAGSAPPIDAPPTDPASAAPPTGQ